MDSLKETVKTVMSSYAKKGFNGHTYLTVSEDGTFLVVTGIGNTRSGRVVSPALAVHIIGDTIVIEADNTNKPLLDALLDAGIARSQIILAYNGELVPEGA